MQSGPNRAGPLRGPRGRYYRGRHGRYGNVRTRPGRGGNLKPQYTRGPDGKIQHLRSLPTSLPEVTSAPTTLTTTASTAGTAVVTATSSTATTVTPAVAVSTSAAVAGTHPPAVFYSHGTMGIGIPDEFPLLPAKEPQGGATPDVRDQPDEAPMPQKVYRLSEGTVVGVRQGGKLQYITLGCSTIVEARPSLRSERRAFHEGLNGEFCPAGTPRPARDQTTGFPSTAGRTDTAGNVSLGLRRREALHTHYVASPDELVARTVIYEEVSCPMRLYVRGGWMVWIQQRLSL